jgi:hypothetical protein
MANGFCLMAWQMQYKFLLSHFISGEQTFDDILMRGQEWALYFGDEL